MQLILHKTTDSNKVINKTLTDTVDLNITLKRDTDIIRPIILLSKVSGINFKQYNYAHIPDLNRYYFINSVESVNNSIDKLSLECDVLETYKADILSSEAIYISEIKDGDNIIYSAESGVNDIIKIVSDTTLEKGESIVLATLGV